jgi:hypothetical protein
LAGLRNPKDVAAFVLEDRGQVFGLDLLVDDGLSLTGQYITLPFNLLEVGGLRMGLTRQGQESQRRGEDKNVPHKGSLGVDDRLKDGQGSFLREKEENFGNKVRFFLFALSPFS